MTRQEVERLRDAYATGTEFVHRDDGVVALCEDWLRKDEALQLVTDASNADVSPQIKERVAAVVVVEPKENDGKRI